MTAPQDTKKRLRILVARFGNARAMERLAGDRDDGQSVMRYHDQGKQAWDTAFGEIDAIIDEASAIPTRVAVLKPDRKSSHLARDHRVTACVMALGSVAGLAGWLITGSIWGATALWMMIAVVVLVMAGVARALGAGEP